MKLTCLRGRRTLASRIRFERISQKAIVRSCFNFFNLPPYRCPVEIKHSSRFDYQMTRYTELPEPSSCVLSMT